MSRIISGPRNTRRNVYTTICGSNREIMWRTRRAHLRSAHRATPFLVGRDFFTNRLQLRHENFIRLL